MVGGCRGPTTIQSRSWKRRTPAKAKLTRTSSVGHKTETPSVTTPSPPVLTDPPHDPADDTQESAAYARLYWPKVVAMPDRLSMDEYAAVTGHMPFAVGDLMGKMSWGLLASSAQLVWNGVGWRKEEGGE